MSDLPELQVKLMRAIPQLTEQDFAYYATDLYVVVYPEVTKWLKENFPFFKNAQAFIGEGANWNGVGKLCYDIPFAGYWKKPIPAS